ncbi:MAG: AraC family transcriptional regulator [Gammaproteobacteria bacterium]|nr:AraC family transcriptional regulator [Gammaproteobacteria bacterium]
MLTIPITFLLALPLALLASWLMLGYESTARTGWLRAFLVVLALQLVLLGVRFGYGVEGIIRVQPLTGVLVPPLAYLAFANPIFSVRVLVHFGVLLAMGLVIALAPGFIDAFLACVTFGYASALAALGARHDSALAWVPLQHARVFKLGLWATVTVLVLSGVTDILVAFDFFATGGTHTERIATGASAVALVLIVAAGWFVYPRRPGSGVPHSQDPANDVDDVMAQIAAVFDRDELYRDPDLSLNRLARRLGLPARRVSEAINQTTGQNVSQFVNERRIRAVCLALVDTDASITQIMLNAGFVTKSNFNREFRRINGCTPSVWRSDKQNALTNRDS